jgi:enolase
MDTSVTPQLIAIEGAGKAYQSVAQSTALAIQDATDNLRNINTICATAIGVAMAQALADPAQASLYQPIITMAEDLAKQAAANFLTIGENASTVLEDYPTG